MPTHDIIDNRKQKLVDHINRILSSTEAAKQLSRGATACQAVSALACPAEDGRRRKRDTRKRHGVKIDERVCRTRQRRLVRLGYRLYGLTAAEIKLVEESVNR